MKKIIALLLMAFVGFSFAGCASTQSSIANSIEENINKLTVLLEKTSDVSNSDIIMSELSGNGNYTAEKASKNPNKINNMPKQEANTQIVKTSTKNLAVVADKNQVNKVSRKNDLNKASNNNFHINRLTKGSYVPRRIDCCNYNNSGLTNYLSKIEDLYLMMNDACGANDECSNLKNNILSSCDILQNLCDKLKNKELKLNGNQTQTCNDCLASLNNYTNNLNNTRNDVKTSCNAVKTMTLNPSAELEQISSKYIKLINCLDDRATCYTNILSILNQLQCVLTGICGEEKIEENLENNIELPIQKMPNQDNEIVNLEDENIIEHIDTPTANEINDYSYKNLQISDLPRHNIDTFRNETIHPNIDFEKKKEIDQNQLNEDNSNTDNEEKNKFEKVNQTNDIDNLPNNTNTINNGPIANNGVGINGYPNGNIPNGVYNNNIISNGYGYHNYENGITNPYRNTDTYKFPINNNGVNNGIYGNGAYNGNGIAKLQPLESEIRKDFKPFMKIA